MSAMGKNGRRNATLFLLRQANGGAPAAVPLFAARQFPTVQFSPLRRSSASKGSNGHDQIRRGLLYMLLGAVIHYFAGGYGAPVFQIPLPAPIMPLLTQYLTPLLFPRWTGIYGLRPRSQAQILSHAPPIWQFELAGHSELLENEHQADGRTCPNGQCD